jgi:hypothetical protein
LRRRVRCSSSMIFFVLSLHPTFLIDSSPSFQERSHLPRIDF